MLDQFKKFGVNGIEMTDGFHRGQQQMILFLRIDLWKLGKIFTLKQPRQNVLSILCAEACQR